MRKIHPQLQRGSRKLASPERVVTNAELTARFTALGKPTVRDENQSESRMPEIGCRQACCQHGPADWKSSLERVVGGGLIAKKTQPAVPLVEQT
jgi:hypothetical protein